MKKTITNRRKITKTEKENVILQKEIENTATQINKLKSNLEYENKKIAFDKILEMKKEKK